MNRSARRRRIPRRSSPALRFSPSAWAKLLFLRDLGNTEVGAIGLSFQGDLLLVRDLVLPRQTCSPVTVSFHDEAVADFFDAQFECGVKPEECGRIWIHTHPGNSPLPSPTDEETFARVFGTCDWAVMAILAENGATYARIRFGRGPVAEFRIPVEVDFACPFGPADPESWAAEYRENVIGWRRQRGDTAWAESLMVHQFTRWLRSLPIDPDLSLNLLSSELTVLASERAEVGREGV